MKNFEIFYFLFFLILICAQKNPHYFDGHDVMVHLFEWKYEDVAKECEQFLGPMGFGGVQVSPIQENVIINSHGQRPWYERYQPVSYKIITRSGNASDFESMIKRCNDAGVRIYVDAVINHMAVYKSGKGTGGSFSDPYHRSYPEVPYNDKNFHKPCAINNWQNADEIRNCELEELPDLDQSQEHVRNKIVDFMNYAIDNGVAGFRIDAAKHMSPIDLSVIYSRLHNLNEKYNFAKGSRPYIYQEVSSETVGSIPGQYTHMGAVTEFKYGWELSKLFDGPNDLKYLVNWGTQWGLLTSEDAFVFIDNHDTQRSFGAFHDQLLTHKKPRPYKMAVAFMLAHPHGQPQIMSSYEFVDFNQGPPSNQNQEILSPSENHETARKNGWVQEHRWRQMYNMVRFRNTVKSTNISNWWDNGKDQIAFCRGKKGFIAFNKAFFHFKQKLFVCLPPGIYCDVISGNIKNNRCTGKSVHVDEKHNAEIVITNKEDGILVIHVGAKLQ